MSKSIHYLFAVFLLACLTFAVNAEEPELYNFENPNSSPSSEDVVDRGPTLRFVGNSHEMILSSRLPNSYLSILVSTHGDTTIHQIEPEQIPREMSRMVLPLASAMLNRGIEKPRFTGNPPEVPAGAREVLMTTQGEGLDISLLLSPTLAASKDSAPITSPVKRDGEISGNCTCYTCQCDAQNCADFCDLCWTIIEALKGGDQL